MMGHTEIRRGKDKAVDLFLRCHEGGEGTTKTMSYQYQRVVLFAQTMDLLPNSLDEIVGLLISQVVGRRAVAGKAHHTDAATVLSELFGEVGKIITGAYEPVNQQCCFSSLGWAEVPLFGSYENSCLRVAVCCVLLVSCCQLPRDVVSGQE